MNLQNPRSHFAVVAMAWGISSCSVANNDDTLNVDSFPSKISVGEKTGLLVATKKARDENGRMITTESYVDFYLVSGNDSVARIVQQRQIYGVKPGWAIIEAKDNASDLRSNIYSITVE